MNEGRDEKYARAIALIERYKKEFTKKLKKEDLSCEELRREHSALEEEKQKATADGFPVEFLHVIDEMLKIVRKEMHRKGCLS